MIVKVFDAPLINPPFTQSCCLGPQATPRRKPNSEYRSREHLTEREVEKLIEAIKDNRWAHPYFANDKRGPYPHDPNRR